MSSFMWNFRKCKLIYVMVYPYIKMYQQTLKNICSLLCQLYFNKAISAHINTFIHTYMNKQ